MAYQLLPPHIKGGAAPSSPILEKLLLCGAFQSWWLLGTLARSEGLLALTPFGYPAVRGYPWAIPVADLGILLLRACCRALSRRYSLLRFRGPCPWSLHWWLQSPLCSGACCLLYWEPCSVPGTRSWWMWVLLQGMMLAGMCGAGMDEGEVHGSKAVIVETIGFSSHHEFPGSGGFQGTEDSPKAMMRCLSLVDRSSQFIWKGLKARDVSWRKRWLPQSSMRVKILCVFFWISLLTLVAYQHHTSLLCNTIK